MEYIPNIEGGEVIAEFKGLERLESVEVDQGMEVLFQARVRTFRLDQASAEWKERGVGQFKVMKDPETDLITMACRREKLGKLCLNCFVLPGVELSRFPDHFAFTVPLFDFSDDDHPTGMDSAFLIEFKTEEEMNQFKEVYDKAREQMAEAIDGDDDEEEDDEGVAEAGAALAGTHL